MKRTKFNSLCTQSNSQSTIRKKTIQAAPHLIIYADPKTATSAGANQITEWPTDTKKWEELRSYSNILVSTLGRIVNFWTNRINAIEHTPTVTIETKQKHAGFMQIIHVLAACKQKRLGRKFVNLKIYSKCIFD